MTCQQFLHSPPIVYCQIYDEVNFVKLLFGIICFENPIPKVRIVITKVMYLLNEVVFIIRYLVSRAISFLIFYGKNTLIEIYNLWRSLTKAGDIIF